MVGLNDPDSSQNDYMILNGTQQQKTGGGGSSFCKGTSGPGELVSQEGTQLHLESGNASCAHHDSSFHLLVLCHAEKPVQSRERPEDWRPEEDRSRCRVPKREEGARQCGVLTDALKLCALWLVWSLQKRKKESSSGGKSKSCMSNWVFQVGAQIWVHLRLRLSK